MNYRHIFHAGCFGDVYKHIGLIAVLESLLNKEKPFCYIDTHAGIGMYNLQSVEAKKTKESAGGIAKIFKNKEKKPAAIDRYVRLVRSLNPDGVLTFYPGSPYIARSLLRPEDKMILTELHPADYGTLKNEFKEDKQVGVHLLDGYQGLKAFLPPQPRRGVVLIDPPYESTDEFETILENTLLALKRWNEGIFMIWYPVKNRPQINYFEHQLARKIKLPYLITELNLYPDDVPLALNGSGLIIINPPWQLDKKLTEILPWLKNALAQPGQGSTRIEFKTAK